MQQFPTNIWTAMLRHAETAYPLEAAGLIVRTATGKYCTISNPDGSLRRNRFEISPNSIIRTRAEGQTICAFYHSHPEGPARLSARDEGSMTADDSPCWPGVDWVIISVNDGQAGEIGQFTWDDRNLDFRKIELKGDLQ